MLAELTRRKFIGLLSAIHFMLSGKSQAAENMGQVERLPIHDLHLPPDELQELNAYAGPVIEAARALDELDLGTLPVSPMEPGFVFIPGQFSADTLQWTRATEAGKNDE